MSSTVVFEFNGFRFEPFNLRLIHDGRMESLTGKAAETLLVLVQQPNVIVPKEVLLAAVWPDVVVEENNLSQQISILRKLLARDGLPELIETVPRRGYRFAGDVRVIASPAAQPATVTPPETGVAGAARVPARRRVAHRAVFASIAAIAIVVASVVWWRDRSAGGLASVNAQARAQAMLDQRDHQAAVEELNRAIALNPRNAEAYAMLAYAMHKNSPNAVIPPGAGSSPALEVAERSVAIDPSCASCHGMLGFILTYHHWQWARAETHFREALRLDPERESVRPSFAMLLAATGRLADAQQQIDLALQVQPYDLTWLYMRAMFLYLDRRYDEAIEGADRVLRINDRQRGAWDVRSKALFQLGRGADAINVLALDGMAGSAEVLERAVRDGGTEGGLRKLLELTDNWKARVEQSWRRATWRSLLGDAEGALDELERAYDQRNVNLIYVAVDPVYERVRSHPRFQRLLGKMGLQPQ